MGLPCLLSHLNSSLYFSPSESSWRGLVPTGAFSPNQATDLPSSAQGSLLTRLTRFEGAGGLCSPALFSTVPFSLQTDVLKCVVSSNPGFHSHWLVTALCSFGRFLKAAFFVLLPER